MAIKLGRVNEWGVAAYTLREGEEYMNSQQRDHFVLILNSWKKHLLDEMSATVKNLKQNHAFYSDPVDQATHEEEFHLELKTRGRDRHLVRTIEESLSALQKGQYGYCEDCDAEIGVRRLEARPTATKCIDCKVVEEIRQKKTHA